MKVAKADMKTLYTLKPKGEITPELLDAVAVKHSDCIILNGNPKLALEVLT